MSAPICGECSTPMVATDSIGTSGYYCPNPSCAADNGPQYQLNYAPPTARTLRHLTVCHYTILSALCRRCGLRYNAADPIDKQYHEEPGGCR